MKTVFCCLMFILNITVISFAQDNRILNSEKVFELGDDYFNRSFLIDLGHGNKLQIDLKDIKDLDRLTNADSILRVFLQDIMPLKDSLSDELTSKRIDYVTDSAGRKKIRIQQFKSKGSNFIVDHGDLAALKLEQDTVNFKNTVSYYAKYKLRRGFTTVRHYRMSLFVNQLSELNDFPEGKLNDKIKLLRENISGVWVNGGGGRVLLSQDRSISAKQAKGYYSQPGLIISPHISIDIQNYKNYFVPSFNLGAVFTMSNSFFKREIELRWEPNFFFAKNSEGKLQTFRNDFLTITFGHGFIKDHQPRKEAALLAIFTYGYLVNRDGDFFAKNTSRFAAGRLSLFEGKIKIEPAIYFNNFFRGVTPTLKFSYFITR